MPSPVSQTFSALVFPSRQQLHVLDPTQERSLKATWMGTNMVALPPSQAVAPGPPSSQLYETCQFGDRDGQG